MLSLGGIADYPMSLEIYGKDIIVRDGQEYVSIRNVLIPRAQVEEWEGNFGGKLVGNNIISAALQKAMWSYKNQRGVWPDALRPSDFPGVEFIPIQIQVDFGMGEFDTPWHAFIGRSIRHAVA